MTFIANPTRYKTKKALREAVEADPTRVFLDDPSMHRPISGSVHYIMDTLINDGRTPRIEVTNHPKRTWFAQIKLVNDKYKVV